MPETRREIDASAEEIWQVLADGWLYASWVVGAAHHPIARIARGIVRSGIAELRGACRQPLFESFVNELVRLRRAGEQSDSTE